MDDRNILGGKDSPDACFSSLSWDESTPSVVMDVLVGLREAGAIDLECDEEVRAVYYAPFPKSEPPYLAMNREDHEIISNAVLDAYLKIEKERADGTLRTGGMGGWIKEQ